MLKVTCVDCDNGFYIDPQELLDEYKTVKLRCPFCGTPGSPVYEMLHELSKQG